MGLYTTGDFLGSLTDWISGKNAKQYRAQMAAAAAEQHAADVQLEIARANLEALKMGAGGKAPSSQLVKGVPNGALLAGGAVLAILLLRRRA